MDTVQRKEVLLLIVTAIISLLFFLGLSFAYQGQNEFAGVSLLLVLLGVLWISTMAVTMALVVNNRSSRWAILILPAVMALFSSGFQVVAIIGSLLLFLTLLAAQQSISQEIKNRLTFTTIGIFRPGVRLLLVGVATFTLALVLPLLKQQVQSGQITFPVETATVIAQSLTPVLSRMMPNYQPTMTVDQIIENQISQQLPPGIAVPANQIEQSRREIGERLNLNLVGSETIPNIIASVANQYIKNLAQGEGLLVTLILVLIALLAIRALIPLLVWPILLCVMAMVYLAHRTHLIRKLPTQVVVERYQL